MDEEGLFFLRADPSAGKSNGLMSTTSSSYVSLQLSGLQRLSQLLISAGGANHLTVDSLFVNAFFSSMTSPLHWSL